MVSKTIDDAKIANDAHKADNLIANLEVLGTPLLLVFFALVVINANRPKIPAIAVNDGHDFSQSILDKTKSGIDNSSNEIHKLLSIPNIFLKVFIVSTLPNLSPKLLILLSISLNEYVKTTNVTDNPKIADII